LPIFAFAPDGEPIDVVNHYINFGWEYVVHCHILSHEEMDMMRSQAVAIAPKAPSNLTATRVGNGVNRRYELTWTDNSLNETAFVIERATSSSGPWTELATVGSLTGNTGPTTGQRAFTDPIGNTNQTYVYQVYAINTVGDTWDYSNPAFNEIPPGGGFPTITLDSRGQTTVAPAAPSGLTATWDGRKGRSTPVTLGWTDNSDAETGFLIQRAENAAFSLNVVDQTIAGDLTTYTEAVARDKTYYYRILAFNAAGVSGWSNTATVTTF
jgi:hypothetical protein